MRNRWVQVHTGPGRFLAWLGLAGTFWESVAILAQAVPGRLCSCLAGLTLCGVQTASPMSWLREDIDIFCNIHLNAAAAQRYCDFE